MRSGGIFQRTRVAAIAAVLLIAAGLAGLAGAEAPATTAFQRTWARTDQPVAAGQVDRTWMWGPQANTAGMMEPYAESPNGQRLVQYYDKSRMELTHPDAVDDGLWYVTNGLLVVEMVSGQLQVGDAQFTPRTPADVNIAGDPGQHPTYADIDRFGLRSQPATPVGTTLTTWLDASGIVATGPTPPTRVTAAERSTTTGLDHTVASVFWDFMTSSGTVVENGQSTQAALFQNPYYATGLPITEAYWSVVKIGGTPQTVLWQCFERRCLTYNPLNGPGWQVEAGNVGQHYYTWRYEQTNPQPTPTGTSQPVSTPTPTSTTAPGQPTNTSVPVTKTTVPATSTSVPATKTTIPATNTSVPATNTQTPQQSYINVKVVDANGNSQLPSGVTVTSNTLTQYVKVAGDTPGGHCGGTKVGSTFTLNIATLTASRVTDPGDYCVELDATGYIMIGSTRYDGRLFSSGIGTVAPGAPAGITNVTIKVTTDSIVH